MTFLIRQIVARMNKDGQVKIVEKSRSYVPPD